MRIHILGSCSGTEPFPGRRHTAFAIEAGGGLYWFDAGEGCSHTAHVLGLDLLSVREIVISHPHMDHVGGLGNLLWNIRKLRHVQNRLPERGINVWIPSRISYDGVMAVLSQSEGGFSLDFDIGYRHIGDGELFSDGVLRVIAMHNGHLGTPEDGIWRTFSFRIEAEGKSIVYSGDCKSISELDCWLDCDLLMMETGHHNAAECAKHLAEKGFKGTLLFVHHGRRILDDPYGELVLARAEYGGNILIADDGTTLSGGEDF